MEKIASRLAYQQAEKSVKGRMSDEAHDDLYHLQRSDEGKYTYDMPQGQEQRDDSYFDLAQTVAESIDPTQRERVNPDNIVLPNPDSVLSNYMEPYSESLDAPPYFESHVRSPRGSNLALSVHSFVGFRFTGVHPRTHQLGRYYVRAGFGASGNDEVQFRNPRAIKGMWKPGGLHNDTHSHADISTQRETSIEDVQHGFYYIPAHAKNSNYHLLEHNCNHFTREIALELGYGDVADLHEGTSPTAAFSNMRQAQENGGEGFFSDYYKETGDYRTDYEGNNSKVQNRGNAELFRQANDKISQINSTLVMGTEASGFDRSGVMDSAEFSSEANTALEAHGLGVFNWRSNQPGQFKTKNEAKPAIAESASLISTLTPKIDTLQLQDANFPMEDVQASFRNRLSSFHETNRRVINDLQQLSIQSGKRYYKLGVFALRAASVFTSLQSRTNALIKSKNITEIEMDHDVRSDFHPAELMSMFAQESKLEKDFSITGLLEHPEEERVYLPTSDFAEENTIRGNFILENAPTFNAWLVRPMSAVLRGADQLKPGEEAYGQMEAAVAQTVYEGLQQMFTENDAYFTPMLRLFYGTRQQIAPAQLANLMIIELSEAAVNTLTVDIHMNEHKTLLLTNPLADLSGNAGPAIDQYRNSRRENLDHNQAMQAAEPLMSAGNIPVPLARRKANTAFLQCFAYLMDKFSSFSAQPAGVQHQQE